MADNNPMVAKAALAIVKSIASENSELQMPPEEGATSSAEEILPFSLVRGTRPYVERITHEINGTYERGWYDACAVMMRRLVETLIIELFEARSQAREIQTTSGDFMPLEKLIGKVTNEPAWNLCRNSKRALPDIKSLGDNSAHARRFVAHRGDIDNIQSGFRTAVQELIILAGLR